MNAPRPINNSYQPVSELDREQKPERISECIEDAWAVIANVGHRQGGWEEQHPEWLAAAKRWRDRWLPVQHEKPVRDVPLIIASIFGALVGFLGALALFISWWAPYVR